MRSVNGKFGVPTHLRTNTKFKNQGYEKIGVEKLRFLCPFYYPKNLDRNLKRA